MTPDPFAADLTRARRDRVAATLAGATLLVSDLINVRYLTGFDGTAGALALRPGEATLYTDSRYLEQAQHQAPGVEVAAAADPLRTALAGQPGPVLLEGHAVPAKRWQSLAAEHPGIALADDDVVAAARATKDAAELAVLEVACRLSADALREALQTAVAGRTEREVARQLEWLLGDGAGEGPGFPSIVASGPNSSRPHHRPTGRQIEPGDLLKIDFGARVRGYHADLTRTFVVARDPEPWQRDVHALVAAAQRAAMDGAVAGASLREVDGRARRMIAEAGHAEHFRHGLGHGVGLQIHERPLIGPTADGTLTEAMAITIEPGVYLPGRGGVRIEDTVVVGREACRPLATLSRDLLVVR